jgi:hypothetical protein
MTPEQRIDAALDSVLKASGSALRYYTMPLTLDHMREAMRKIMSDSYIAGSNDNSEAMKKARPDAKVAGSPALSASPRGLPG